ncbi:hypothetical protein N665_2432s0006 [Sinapis alba]|nr:hypothetical protein N665_2432s0006 [Sinapis alba]
MIWKRRIVNYIFELLKYIFFLAVFNYNPRIHNVVVVDSGGYNNCKTPGGARKYTSGKDRITLSKGQNFFICNFPGHCEAAMKIAVTAV